MVFGGITDRLFVAGTQHPALKIGFGIPAFGASIVPLPNSGSLIRENVYKTLVLKTYYCNVAVL
jgi:hypothetical protein